MKTKKTKKLTPEMIRKQNEEKLRKALTRCLVMSDEDKAFWLGQIPTLPEEYLAKVLTAVEKKNEVVDGYIKAELENDPDHKYLAEMEKKIKKTIREAFAMEEAGKEGAAEEKLEKELNKI